jgi:hypothetical protein
MIRKRFRLGARVRVNGACVGHVHYHLSNGRILVRNDADNVRAYYPDALTLIEDTQTTNIDVMDAAPKRQSFLDGR